MPPYNSEKQCKSNTRYPKHSAEFSAGIITSDLSHLSPLCQGLLMSRTDLCQGPFKTFVYQVWGLFFFHSVKVPSFVFLICADYSTVSFLLILVPQHWGPQGSIWPCSAAGSWCLPCCCSWKPLACGTNHYPNSASRFKTVSVLDWEAKCRIFDKGCSQ